MIDEETGLYYMNARYYDPATGRFISQDTYRGTGEAFWHAYLYCNGDPVNNVDPSGHSYAETVKNGAWLSNVIVSSTALSWVPGLGWVIVLSVAVAGTYVYVKYKYPDNYFEKFKNGERVINDIVIGNKAPTNKQYKVAYLNSNMLIKVGNWLDFKGACVALGITGIKNFNLNKRYYLNESKSTAYKKYKNKPWGIYAKSQRGAKALATVFGSKSFPRLAGYGGYGHYHDSQHLFHIWFGERILPHNGASYGL